MKVTTCKKCGCMIFEDENQCPDCGTWIIRRKPKLLHKMRKDELVNYIEKIQENQLDTEDIKAIREMYWHVINDIDLDPECIKEINNAMSKLREQEKIIENEIRSFNQ